MAARELTASSPTTPDHVPLHTGAGTRSPAELGGEVTLARLKWLAIVLPVAFLSLLWILVHSAFGALHHFPDIFILLGLMSLGVGGFAFAVFEVVNRLEQRVVARNRELAVLLTVGRAASSSLVLGELLDAATTAVLGVLPVHAAEVWLLEDDRTLRLVRRRGIDGATFVEGDVAEFADVLPTFAFGGSAPVILYDAASGQPPVPERLRSLGFGTYCGLPLRHRQELVGVLGVASQDGSAFCTEWDMRLLQGIGEWIALALANARLHEEVLDGAVLEERLRIARELHDGLAQVLTYINAQALAVERLLETGRNEEARAEVAAMKHAARQVYGDVREAIVGLRTSLARPALVPALRRYLGEYERTAGASLQLEIPDEVEGLELPASVEIQLIRVVQEALANVRKHADATAATVRLALADGRLKVEVEDDGRGFDPATSVSTGWPRFGLQTMHERAQAVGGSFELTSQPGAGTRIAVTVPLIDAREAAVAGLAG